MDKRCVALRLVEKGLCDAALFNPSGKLPSLFFMLSLSADSSLTTSLLLCLLALQCQDLSSRSGTATAFGAIPLVLTTQLAREDTC